MFVRTDRLLLRPGWAEDASALAAAIGEERIVRNLARAPWPYGVDDARAFLSRPATALPSLLIFLRSRRPPELVGGIGLGATPGGAVELGCWIASAHWNRGFVTEAGRAVLAVARHGLRLRRLVASHYHDNPASGRVLEKLGFEATGEGLQHSRVRGGPVMSRNYALDLCEPAVREEECIAA